MLGDSLCREMLMTLHNWNSTMDKDQSIKTYGSGLYLKIPLIKYKIILSSEMQQK